jgi:hypothetical protein
MARRIVLPGLIFLGLLIIVALWNYNSAYRPVSESLSSDARNEGVEVLVHYKWFINPRVLVFDLRRVSKQNSPADVTRTLLQASGALKSTKFDYALLSYRGNAKFMLQGDFFQNLGVEYGVQNPIYTLRTLPQNVYNLDGTPAFGTWTGGWLGVTNKQMEDLNEFYRKWFLSDL